MFNPCRIDSRFRANPLFAGQYSDPSSQTLIGRYAGDVRQLEAATLAVVGAREPEDALYRALAARPQDLREAGIRTLQKIGDCDVPGAVVHATDAGHRLARGFDANVAPMLFERATLPETLSPDSQRNR